MGQRKVLWVRSILGDERQVKKLEEILNGDSLLEYRLISVFGNAFVFERTCTNEELVEELQSLRDRVSELEGIINGLEFEEISDDDKSTLDKVLHDEDDLDVEVEFEDEDEDEDEEEDKIK